MFERIFVFLNLLLVCIICNTICHSASLIYSVLLEADFY
jgi:hypothetical protein